MLPTPPEVNFVLVLLIFFFAYSFNNYRRTYGSRGKNRPSTGFKTLLNWIFFSVLSWPAKGFQPISHKLKLDNISLICNSFSFVSTSLVYITIPKENKRKRKRNYLRWKINYNKDFWRLRYPVGKSKFGTCAVTGLCSFKAIIHTRCFSRASVSVPFVNSIEPSIGGCQKLLVAYQRITTGGLFGE